MKRQILSVLLTITLALSIVSFSPFSVIAGETENGGDGNTLSNGVPIADSDWADAISTSTDLYIWDASDLIAFGEYLGKRGATDINFEDKIIHIKADIDMKGVDWFSFIERGRQFSGFIDGHGHTISNFDFSGTDKTMAGLFGGRLLPFNTNDYIYSVYGFHAGIKDLTILNAKMIIDNNSQGGLFATVGKALSKAGSVLFENVYVDVIIEDKTQDVKQIGGFVGYSCTDEIIFNNCLFKGNLAGTTEVGGFIGHSESESLTFTDCASVGTVKGTKNVGGFVGQLKTGTLTVDKSAFYGTITSDDDTCTNLGGVLGSAEAGSVELRNSIIGGKIAVGSDVPLSTAAQLVGYIKTGALCSADKTIFFMSLEQGTTVNYMPSVTNTESSVDPNTADIVLYNASETVTTGNNAVLTGMSISGASIDLKLYFTPMPDDFPMPDGVVNLMWGQNKIGGTKFVGHQTAVNGNTQDVRLVAVVDGIGYKEVGFDVVLSTGEKYSVWAKDGGTNIVYTEISGGGIIYSAEDFGGKFFFTVTCKSLPSGYGDVTFTVKTYHVDVGTTARVYDDVYLLTVSTGN